MSTGSDEGAAHMGRPLDAGSAGGAPAGWELIARCVADRHRGDPGAAVTIVSDAESPRALAASHFFRSVEDMPPVEQEALRRSRGRVLDVGAGAGAHALALQEAGHPVTALELSEACVGVMRERGVLDARRGDVLAPAGDERWDTILMLMNGTTLVGSSPGLVRLFESASARLAPGGCILIDSTDLREEPGCGEDEERSDGRYVGEVHLQVSYRGELSDPFPVLYAHPGLLAACADAAGLDARVVMREEDGTYLAELRRRRGAAASR